MRRKAHEDEPFHPGEPAIAEERFLLHVRRFVESRSWHILIGVLAVAVVVIAVKGYRNRRQADERAMWSQFSMLPAVSPWLPEEEAKKLRAEVVTRCSDILANHWETDATPWVMLKLASTQLEAGSAAEAESGFRRLIDEYGETTAGRLALQPYGYALEEQKRHGEAAAWFQGLVARLPEMRTQLLWDAARNLEAAGENADAVAAYEALLKTDPDGEVERLAQWRIRVIQSPRPVPTPSEPATDPGPDPGAEKQPEKSVE